MALSAEQIELVELFMKETEDLILAKIVSTFLIKYGTLSATSGNNVVSWTASDDVTSDDPYADTTYVIDIIEALDSNGVDVKGELEIPTATKTVNGFTINAMNACTIKWQTSRKAPLINFWT